jgi:hypothetical protein
MSFTRLALVLAGGPLLMDKLFGKWPAGSIPFDPRCGHFRRALDLVQRKQLIARPHERLHVEFG